MPRRRDDDSRLGIVGRIVVVAIIVGLVIWRVSKDRPKGRRRSAKDEKGDLDQAFEELLEDE